MLDERSLPRSHRLVIGQDTSLSVTMSLFVLHSLFLAIAAEVGNDGETSLAVYGGQACSYLHLSYLLYQSRAFRSVGSAESCNESRSYII
jgi:hypothetical protein